MGKPRPADEQSTTPEFDQLVRELDELLRSLPEAEPQPPIEELFLARMREARPLRRRRVG
ncbi:MAG TPA: hypothetical protein VLD85_10425 [Anaeromyxobacteraceae bacterium]|nr:hypothetical protein [Anaeromyxobacteraceae bacterium]